MPSNASVVPVACLATTAKSPVVSAAAAAAVAAIAATDQNFENDVEEAKSPTPKLPMVDDYGSYIDWGSVLNVVFDLETTGRSRQRDEIIELAAVILNKSGVEIEDPFLSSQKNPYHSSLRS
jgi:Exonuclease